MNHFILLIYCELLGNGHLVLYIIVEIPMLPEW